MKSVKSQKGYTLLLVLGFVMLLVLLITPLAMSLNNGLLQAQTDGHSEEAFSEAESGASVYKRIFEEAARVEGSRNSSLTDADARALAVNMNSLGLFPSMTVAPVDQAGVLKSVEFASTSGEGPQKRGRVMALGFEQVTTTTTETVTIPGGDTFYNKHGVVINQPRYNYVFTPPAETLSYDSPSRCTVDICNNYTGNYAQEFNDYLKKYTGDSYPLNQNAMMRNWQNAPLLTPLAPLAVPDQVLNLPNTIIDPVNIYNRVSGLKWGGNVNLVTQNASIGVLPSGNSMEVAGSLTLPQNTATTFQGGLQIGGDFIVSGNGNLTINGSVLVKGNVKWTSQYKTIWIKGNLWVQGDINFAEADSLIVDGSIIAGGKITYSKKIPAISIGGSLTSKGAITFDDQVSIKIAGDLIAAGDLSFPKTVEDGLDVNGAISAGGDILFATIERLSVGAWTTEWNGDVNSYVLGRPRDNNRQPFIAGGTVSFTNRINYFRVSGDFSSKKYNASNQLDYVRIGGSWLTGGNATFNNTVVDWWTGGNIYVDNVLTIMTTTKLVVGGNIYAKMGFSVGNAVDGQLSVGGSILSTGKVEFTNTITNATIMGDVIAKASIYTNGIVNMVVKGSMVTDGSILMNNTIVNLAIDGSMLSKSSVTFNQNVDRMKVGGSLVAGGGDLYFKNHIGTSEVSISGDLITAGDMSFTEIKGLTVTGMVTAKRNMTISLNIANPTKLGGFYAGGTTTMANWYGTNSNEARKYIKIVHVPTPTTTTRTVTITSTKASTKWTSRLTSGTP
ncbi:hypothetical protein [Gorillibacterium sp. sgz500922]|uniref:hypothetical protein n=1 Tax=Gorillibacterium sp. sgz500922 TaxID=3446694 RepID=UPI003F6636F6